MGKKRVLVSYGVDIDAVAGWLGSVSITFNVCTVADMLLVWR
jgi:hypothetical protein